MWVNFWRANVIKIQSRKIIYVCSVHPYFHSSTAGHVDCFYALATESNAAMNIQMRMSFHIGLFVFFEHKYSVMELLNKTVVLLLVLVLFEETPYCLPYQLHQFSFQPVYEGSLYSTSWSRFHNCVLSDDSHSVSHCGFYFHVRED